MKLHPKQEDAKWVKLLLGEELSTVDELFLYGSVSKLDPWDAALLQPLDENTDFDYAVAARPDTHRELTDKGWELKPELDYQDAQTTYIFEKVFAHNKVQISLRQDLPLFKEAWNSIPNRFYWVFLNKRSPVFIGRESVKTYLDQLFYLLRRDYREKKSYCSKSLYIARHVPIAIEEVIRRPMFNWDELAAIARPEDIIVNGVPAWNPQ